jgi:hypothetical protein
MQAAVAVLDRCGYAPQHVAPVRAWAVEMELAGKTTAELTAILAETDARLAELRADDEPSARLDGSAGGAEPPLPRRRPWARGSHPNGAYWTPVGHGCPAARLETRKSLIYLASPTGFEPVFAP